jgi:uncharacterized damage-inducible protein DinB
MRDLASFKCTAKKPFSMNVEDLIRYNHAVRELYLEALAKLPWEEVVKARGLSFDSARNVFLHLTLVEDRWISYILPNRMGNWKDPYFETYQDLNSIRDYANRTKASTEKFLQEMKPHDWNKKATLPWKNFPSNTQITFETALTHMVLEDMIHYGELSAMLWQMNLEAPYLAFARFKLLQEKAEN